MAKHRGWLLVYELQYWLALILSVGVFLMSTRANSSSLLGLLTVLAFWGIPIGALYGTTSAVRRGHIVWCWLLVIVSTFQVFTTQYSTTSTDQLIGELLGGIALVTLWLAWALYWQKSERVKRAYPPNRAEAESLLAK